MLISMKSLIFCLKNLKWPNLDSSSKSKEYTFLAVWMKYGNTEKSGYPKIDMPIES